MKTYFPSFMLLCLMQRAGVPTANPVFLWPTTGNHPAPVPEAFAPCEAEPEFQLI